VSDDALNIISPAQCRAARALLRWKQDDLKVASSVAKKTIADFELEQRQPYDRTLLDIRRALEAAGIEFLAENGDVGVLLKNGSLPGVGKKP